MDAINEFVVLTSGDEEITWPFGLDENISYDGNRLKTAIRFANRRCWRPPARRSEYEGMATTVAAVLVDGEWPTSGTSGTAASTSCAGGHQPAHLRPLLGERAAPERRDLRGPGPQPPLRNVVTRALGGKADLQVDMQVHKIQPGDLLMLCSDGLTTMMPDEEMGKIVGRRVTTS